MTPEKYELTPTEAVIARLTVENEELRRDVQRLHDQLGEIEKSAISLVNKARVDDRWLR